MFNCLTKPFRHGVGKHGQCFRAVAVITQYAIENGEPLFEVKYNDIDITREYAEVTSVYKFARI